MRESKSKRESNTFNFYSKSEDFWNCYLIHLQHGGFGDVSLLKKRQQMNGFGKEIAMNGKNCLRNLWQFDKTDWRAKQNKLFWNREKNQFQTCIAAITYHKCKCCCTCKINVWFFQYQFQMEYNSCIIIHRLDFCPI